MAVPTILWTRNDGTIVNPKIMLNPITFAVGPEMSGAICEVLEARPGISDTEVARAVGAQPSHPFFLTDLAVAHAWLAIDSIPTTRLEQLERQQRTNVRLAVAIDAAITIDAGIDELRTALPVVRALERGRLSSDHLVLAIHVLRLREVIADAGDITTPLESVLRDCLDADPDLLRPDADVSSEAVKKVLSGLSAKGPAQRTIEVPVDPNHISGGVTIEGETDREHGGEFRCQNRDSETNCEASSGE